MNFARTRT